MSNINVSGHMARKSITRDLSGNIINLIDETDGGWIIRNRRVVNEDKYNNLLKKEEDRKIAAKAVLDQGSSAGVDRTAPPSKVEELNKQIAEQAKLIAELTAKKNEQP